MQSDMDFPEYLRRMIFLSLIMTFGGAILLFPLGKPWWQGWFLGSLFNVFFFFLMKGLYKFWSLAGKDMVYIGERVAAFSSARFLVGIAMCVLVELYTSFHILAFAAGLLSLRISIYIDAIRSVIKK